MSYFEDAVSEVLKAEGGLLISDGEGAKGTVGGGANFGITLTTLRVWRKDPNLTLDDLRALTVEEARTIYKTIYWDKLGLDAVAGRLSAILIMDQAVNRGVGGITVQLRSTLGKFGYSSLPKIGDMIEKINLIDDREFFRRLLADTQLAYIEIAQRNPEKTKNLKGWLVRTHNLMKLLL